MILSKKKMPTKEKKITLLSLCREAHISTQQLARAAGVGIGQCYAVEIGGFCQMETAKLVLEAFNHLSQQRRTLEEIQWQKPVQWSATRWNQEH